VRVVLVSGSLPAVRCGIGEYTARMASQLARTPGMTVQVLTTRSDLVEPGAVAPAQLLPPVRDWGLPSVVRSARRFRQLEPDVVHLQYPAVGYARSFGILTLPLVTRLLVQVPVVLTIHERSERRWHGRLATDFLASTSNRVVVPDPVEGKLLRRRLRIFGTRVDIADMISTIPVLGGIDPRAFRARLGLAPGTLLIGTYGLIHPRRRIEDLIDALALLRAQLPAHLLIIGGEADYDAHRAREYAGALKRRTAELGLDRAVTWLGYARPEEVSAALQTCDAVVLLYQEGASARNTTLQAALEHRRPVVTTDGPATSDVLRRTPNLHLVRAGAYTPADLTEAIRSAARAGWSDAGSVAGSRLAEQVAWHLSLYRELTAGAARTPTAVPPS
jgi:glycosyltransferase involved in cell wall biosynthesis